MANPEQPVDPKPEDLIELPVDETVDEQTEDEGPGADDDIVDDEFRELDQFDDEEVDDEEVDDEEVDDEEFDDEEVVEEEPEVVEESPAPASTSPQPVASAPQPTPPQSSGPPAPPAAPPAQAGPTNQQLLAQITQLRRDLAKVAKADGLQAPPTPPTADEVADAVKAKAVNPPSADDVATAVEAKVPKPPTVDQVAAAVDTKITAANVAKSDDVKNLGDRVDATGQTATNVNSKLGQVDNKLSGFIAQQSDKVAFYGRFAYRTALLVVALIAMSFAIASVFIPRANITNTFSSGGGSGSGSTTNSEVQETLEQLRHGAGGGPSSGGGTSESNQSKLDRLKRGQ